MNWGLCLEFVLSTEFLDFLTKLGDFVKQITKVV